ncbi:AbiTii domain-containing protein [Listeria booriae]|uniref:AbiTii domain-containing protein n=1 Tax=Listeria booriae TaxID=1552123 RepID=UPI00162951EB|nr:hypothetical protein [Listeria booriae]MBC2324667.1 hypothetical protein [Listeria booriae]
MGLIIEIQEMASDNNVEVKNLVKQAYSVAIKLQITDKMDWLNKEMRGYLVGDEIPEYRKFRGILKAKNPNGSWSPVFIDDQDVEDKILKGYLEQSVAELEDFYKQRKGENLQRVLNGPQQHMLAKLIGPDVEYAIYIPSNTFSRSLEQVKVEILEWALELEKQGVLGDNQTFTKQEKEIVAATYTVNYFHGNHSPVNLQQNSDNSQANQAVTYGNTMTELVALLKQNQKNIEEQLLLWDKLALKKAEKKLESNDKSVKYKALIKIKSILLKVAEKVAVANILVLINELIASLG